MTVTFASVGKIRALSATSTRSHVFTILAFDHRGSFIKMLEKNSTQVEFGDIIRAKSKIIQALSPHASAVLLDPLYSASQSIMNQSLPGDVGLLVALEESGYSGEPTERMTVLLDGWSVAKIKKMGANAVKILIYYHPDGGKITEELDQLVMAVIQDCQKSDIPLFLEPVTYSINPLIKKDSEQFAANRQNLVIRTAHRLGTIGPDILKMEFPVDSNRDKDIKNWEAACAALTEAAPRPWALLSAGVDYELFKKQVEVACRHGASGYIAGRAVWKEAVGMPNKEQEDWLKSVGVTRLDELSEIAHRYARPWTEYYPDMENVISEGWYKTY
jgi:tagatose 1,6-diphosphate aldolase